ncbi:MAG: LAGLIDADG family homing endonuclease [Chloroflexia bacterium]
MDIEGRDESRVESVRLLRRLDPDLMENKHQVPPSVFRGSREMQIGFLQALFTADGTVAGTTQKGYSVRLASSRLVLLEDVQRLLLNLGIYSKIYRERGRRASEHCRTARAEPRSTSATRITSWSCPCEPPALR